MKPRTLIILALLVAAAIAPAVQGQGSATSGGACDFYRHQSVVAILNVINAGDNEFWSARPACGIARSPTEIVKWAGAYNGPVLPGVTAGTAAYAWSFAAAGGLVGCTAGAITAAGSSAAGGSEADAYADITMTSNECHGVVTFSVNIVVAAVTVYQWRSSAPIDIRVEQEPYAYLCRATGITGNAFNSNGNACSDPIVNGNQFNFLCDAPGIVPNSFNPAATVCNDPNIALTGTLTATLGGTLDVLTRLCAASATGAACTTPTINAVLSGTLDNLNRLCAASTLGSACTAPTISAALSGTVNNVNSGTLTLAGTLDVLARLCAASATGTSCTPATINAVLSGVVHPCSTALLAADVNACRLDTTASNGSVNNTNNVLIDRVHLCGPQVTPGDCTPVVSASTATVAFPTLTFLIVAAIATFACWLYAASSLMVVRLWGITILTFDGFYAASRFSDLPQGAWLAILLWFFAAAFFFYMALQEVMRNIARLKDRRAQAATTAQSNAEALA